MADLEGDLLDQPFFVSKMAEVPYVSMSVTDLHWLAGILEGEGSFTSGPPSAPNTSVIGLNMTDEDVVARIAELFGRKYHRVKRKQKAHHKQSFRVNLTGGNARILMRKLYPMMSHRWKEKIANVLAAHDPLARMRSEEMRKKIPESSLPDIVAAHANGESLRSIGRRYGVNHETVRNRIKFGNPKGLDVCVDDRMDFDGNFGSMI